MNWMQPLAYSAYPNLFRTQMPAAATPEKHERHQPVQPSDHSARKTARRWKQSTLILTMLCLLPFLAFAAPRAALGETLEILAEDDAAPWSLPDGTGFSNDVVRAAFRAVDIDITLRVLPYARCKSLTLSGEAVACFSMSWAPELEGKVVFSEKPLFKCYADYFQASDRPLPYKNESEISKKLRVGIVTAYEYPPSVYALQKRGLVELESTRSDQLNLKKLVQGRLDAALLNYNELKSSRWILATAGVDGKAAVAFRSGVLASHIGFSVKHPHGARVRGKFDEGLRIVESNGTLSQIQSQWSARIEAETQRLLTSRSGDQDKPVLRSPAGNDAR